MATVTRQPFAPLDGARLQNLTSLKNRQNAISSTTGKRKAAELIDADDFENVDPSIFAKRSKSSNGGLPSKDIFKPSAFVLKTSTPAPAPVPAVHPDVRALTSPTKSRRTLQPRSPAAKLNLGLTKSSPIHAAPAGRSPTRGKRSGLLSSRRRTVGPYTRVDPPRFSLGSGAPFSLDAALKGTIPGYGSSKPTSISEGLNSLYEPELKSDWFFDIHEDTPEEEMTNLLQHNTCTLDISSDEESEKKASREKAEGRDKENVPPIDDVSQTSARQSSRQVSADDMVFEKERVALGALNTADFYPEGYDETSVIFVPADDDVPEEPQVPELSPAKDFKYEHELDTQDEDEIETQPDIDALISRSDERTKAAVLEPIEGTGESFELWESDSTKDETESAALTS